MEKVCMLYQPPGEHNAYSNVTDCEEYCKFTSISQTYLTTESLILATIVIIHGLRNIYFSGYILLAKTIEISIPISFISKPVLFIYIIF